MEGTCVHRRIDLCWVAGGRQSILCRRRCRPPSLGNRDPLPSHLPERTRKRWETTGSPVTQTGSSADVQGSDQLLRTRRLIRAPWRSVDHRISWSRTLKRSRASSAAPKARRTRPEGAECGEHCTDVRRSQQRRVTPHVDIFASGWEPKPPRSGERRSLVGAPGRARGS